MKYKIKIAKFIKLYRDLDENDGDSLYEVIDTYMSTYYGLSTSMAAITLDRALYKMVKKLDRSKLKVDIFDPNPKFTRHCPTDLVKYEYQKFFTNDEDGFMNKEFLQLLQLVGVEKFTINYDEATDGDDCYDD